MRFPSRSLRPFALLVVLTAGLLGVPPAAGAPPAADEGLVPPFRSRVEAPVGEGRSRSVLGADGERVTRGAVGSPPASSAGFDAWIGNGNISPGDPTGAAGDTYVVVSGNVHYAVYQRDGTEVIGKASLRSLFAGTGKPIRKGAQIFDPKVVYDHFNDRFVLVFLAIKPKVRYSRILIVSIPDGTANDTGTWCRRSISGDRTPGDGKQFADYPDVGFDGTRVAITTNQFRYGGAFSYAQVLVAKADQLAACGSAVNFTKFSGKRTRNPNGTKAFSIRPAQTDHADGTLPDRMYMLSFQDTELGGLRGKRLTLWRLKPGGGRLRLSRTSLPVVRAVFPPFGTQKGAPVGNPNGWWDTGDLRLINAFHDAKTNRLYAAHTVLKKEGDAGNDPESAIRWYEVEPLNTLSSSQVLRKGLIVIDGVQLGWPNVATDEAGNLFITHSRATGYAPKEYLSAWVAQVAPGQSGTTYEGTTELRAGEARYEFAPGYERWGDYNAINRDPTDPAVLWSFNQHAKLDGGGVSNFWQLNVHQVSDAP